MKADSASKRRIAGKDWTARITSAGIEFSRIRNTSPKSTGEQRSLPCRGPMHSQDPGAGVTNRRLRRPVRTQPAVTYARACGDGASPQGEKPSVRTVATRIRSLQTPRLPECILYFVFFIYKRYHENFDSCQTLDRCLTFRVPPEGELQPCR